MASASLRTAQRAQAWRTPFWAALVAASQPVTPTRPTMPRIAEATSASTSAAPRWREPPPRMDAGSVNGMDQRVHRRDDRDGDEADHHPTLMTSAGSMMA